MPTRPLTLSVAGLLVSLAVACATAPTTPTSEVPAAPETPAPLVDRELYFDNPEMTGAQLSPDGAYITFLKPHQTVMNVWVKGRTEPFSAARVLTADKRPVPAYFWTRDSRYVLYVQDKGGDENYHVYRVDPRAPASAAGAPEAVDLTPGNKLRARIVALPKRTPDTILVGLNDRDEQVHDVYRVAISTGKRELVRLNKENVAGWTADLEGQLRLATKVNDTGGTEVYRLVGDKLELLAQCTAEESCGPVQFHKDGKRVYFETNAGADDLSRLALIDVATGKEEFVESDPEKQVDFGGADFSEATDELCLTSYTGDRERYYPKTPDCKRDLEALQKAVPGSEVSFVSRTADERLQIAVLNRDVDPGAFYLYDRQAGTVELLMRPRPRLPLETLVPMKPVRITARDGVVLSAYVSVPKGTAGPGPAVVQVHGGPWARDTWGYDSFAQFLANRGYTVLSVNFRGSTGYGKKFLNLGNGQWGGTMQNDLTDAREWLIKNGYAKADKVAIMGGSYGGYATLAGLAFTPDIWAAGVDIVGPSSIITLLNSIPPYWAPLKKTFAVRVGDVEKPADRARLEAQSPLGQAKAINKPLLVIQGANDPRVKKAEAERIVMAVRDNGKPVEYLVAADEGHGFRGRENRMAMMLAIERFLARHLGGRAQQTVGRDISAKLAALTVDVATVTVSRPPAKFAPPTFTASALKPAQYRYKVSGTIAGKPIEGSSAVSITKPKKAGGTWTVTSVDKLPFGESTETVSLDPKTLLPTSRQLKQGGATIDLTYVGNAVKGSIKAGPQTMPVDAKGEGPLVVDGTALGVLGATLPLAAGYQASMSAFDLEGAKMQVLSLVVKGEEKVTVPAGGFDAWKVEMVSEGSSSTTMWVEKGGAKRLVKLVATMPQGSLAQELEK